jgi:hypothetical protein
LLRLDNVFSSIIVKTCALVAWQNSLRKKCTTKNHLEGDDHAKLFISDENPTKLRKGKNHPTQRGRREGPTREDQRLTLRKHPKAQTHNLGAKVELTPQRRL